MVSDLYLGGQVVNRSVSSRCSDSLGNQHKKEVVVRVCGGAGSNTSVGHIYR